MLMEQFAARGAASQRCSNVPRVAPTGSLSVNAITIQASRESPSTRNLIDEILHSREDTLTVFFANTGAPASHGIQRGRDWWVMTGMAEMGLPFARMLRLAGGFRAWIAAGHPSVPHGRVPGTRRIDDLGGLLDELSLAHLREPLAASRVTLAELTGALRDGDRVACLSRLKQAGVSRLAERQRLAGGVARAHREGVLA
jgi:hypothetical protein